MGKRRPRRDPPTYLLDECFCSDLVVAKLTELAVSFKQLSDAFARDADDVDFLPEVGRLGWVLLTKDKEMRRDQLERETILASGVAAFFLPVGKRTGAELADLLAAALPKIERFWALHQPPFIARVTPACDIVPRGEVVRRSGVKRDHDDE